VLKLAPAEHAALEGPGDSRSRIDTDRARAALFRTQGWLSTRIAGVIFARDDAAWPWCCAYRRSGPGAPRNRLAAGRAGHRGGVCSRRRREDSPGQTCPASCPRPGCRTG
jgi:hypothetical protein